ncbi:MAG: hypothetical protein PF636_00495 [Actinomycetota bacterium]|nr:hypothetical protein [Actinomycetota bacterium]
MPEFNKDEALAFIEAMRLTLNGKVGFKWLVEKLSLLSAYIESVALENEQLNTYLDQADTRKDFESFCAGATGRADEPGTQDTDQL